MKEMLIKQGVKSQVNSKMNSAKNMFKIDNQAGNVCLFMFFVMFNICIFLSSIAIIGIDIYLFVICKGANMVNVSFIIVGVLLLLFSICAFRMRRSIHLLCMYLIILLLFFVFQFTISIILIMRKETFIKIAEETIPVD